MYPGVIFINVWNCRALVAQYVSVPGGMSFEHATNAFDLEAEAIEAIQKQGGGFNMSGHYVCPADLAAKAVF